MQFHKTFCESLTSSSLSTSPSSTFRAGSVSCKLLYGASWNIQILPPPPLATCIVFLKISLEPSQEIFWISELWIGNFGILPAAGGNSCAFGRKMMIFRCKSPRSDVFLEGEFLIRFVVAGNFWKENLSGFFSS